jgi:hypothetical protein
MFGPSASPLARNKKLGNALAEQCTTYIVPLAGHSTPKRSIFSALQYHCSVYERYDEFNDSILLQRL